MLISTSTISGPPGTTFAARSGASTKELKAGLGHDGMRALIYERATSDADERIAQPLSELVDEHRAGSDEEFGPSTASG